jgi:arylsulfatase A-like enzyme
VNYSDVEVGRILERLKQGGLLKDTVVFFLTDHGISQARGKQFLYEEGILIPFVAWGPGILPEGKVREEFIAHIDLGTTSLQLAGIDVPKWMQGRPLFGDCAKPREFVVSARDRCDETVDRIRSVRKGSFKYIRNFYPQRAYLQPNRYKDGKPFMPTLRDLFADGKLNATQSLQLSEVRPEEELYDLSQDPWEVYNLAGDPEYREQLSEMRGILANWILDSNDLGRFPESDSMYDSDMELNLNKGRIQSPERTEVLKANIALMKEWQAEGK